MVVMAQDGQERSEGLKECVKGIGEREGKIDD